METSTLGLTRKSALLTSSAEQYLRNCIRNFMKMVNLKIASQILALGLLVSTTSSLKAQTAVNDLDRDGISNISDTDVDNDGILNGSDSNIDGGVAKSGPLKGQYIGDRIANDNAAELDMDADGLLDNAANESDIDGDRLADNAALELDIDADGRADTAANDTDIDGDGLSDNAVSETDIDGDGLADDEMTETDIDGDSVLDNAVAEKDIDGDGLLDNAAAETDIDGDALADSASNETDIDGDGLADDAVTETDLDGDSVLDNAVAEQDIDGDGLSDEASNEFDMDGDAIINANDTDKNGDGILDINQDPETGFIYDGFQADEAPPEKTGYARNSSVAGTIAFVSEEVSRVLQIPANDGRLGVAVYSEERGTFVSGAWWYSSADGILLKAEWCFPSSDPSQLKVFAVLQHNPDGTYVLTEANQIIAWASLSGQETVIQWLPANPASFLHQTYQPNKDYSELLKAALSSHPGFAINQVISGFCYFTGSLTSTPDFPGVQPILNLMRTLQQVSKAAYGL